MRGLFRIAALFCLFYLIHAISIDIEPHNEECFFEDMNIGDRLTVTFQVSCD
jgi:hypothetical protein